MAIFFILYFQKHNSLKYKREDTTTKGRGGSPKEPTSYP
jgi:hypothetical protein